MQFLVLTAALTTVFAADYVFVNSEMIKLDTLDVWNWGQINIVMNDIYRLA